MTGSITLDDFDIVRDSNGNLVIRDDTDTTIATYDNTADEWQFADAVSVTELIDGASVSHTGELADLSDVVNISISDDGTAVLSEPTDANFGSNLTVSDDGDGTVTIDATATSGVDVSDDGTLVASGASDINFATNLSVTDDADGTVTVDGSGGTSSVKADYEFFVENDAGTYRVYDSSGEVSSGASWSVQMQYAVDNLPAGGGKIVLGPQTHDGDGTVDITTAGTSLYGTDGSLIQMSVAETCFSIQASDVTVSNFEIDGQNTGGDTEPYTWGIRTPDNQNTTEYTNIEITNNEIYNVGTGIFGKVWSKSAIRNNKVYNVTADGYGIVVDPDGGVYATDIEITSNYVDNIYYNGIGAYADCEQVTIANNIVKNCGHSAIACSTATHANITGNTVSGVVPTANNAPTGEAGIEIEKKGGRGTGTSHDVTVAGNSVDDCNVGIVVRGKDDGTDLPYGITIGNNVITDSTNQAVYVVSGDNIVIDGNVGSNNTTFLDTSGGTNVLLGNNQNIDTSTGTAAPYSVTAVVDDFEDGGITEYGGDTGVFSVQSTTVLEGSNTLEATGAASSSIISSTAGLVQYPSQSDTFRCAIQTDNTSSEFGILYATQTEDGQANISGYAASLSMGGGEIRLRRYDSGSGTIIGSAAYSASTNTTYIIEVDWTTGGDHTVRLLDDSETELAIISSTNDANYTSGGVGYIFATGNTSDSAFYDYYGIL